MAHAHAHAHSHLDARRAENRSRMTIALAINVVLLVGTVVGGILTDSLALLADAGHLLSDVGAIAIGLVAARLAARAPTPARTYGLQRSEVLGALANGVLLVVIAVLIVVEALGRFGSPPEVSGGGMLAVGLAGLAGNLAATWVLASGDREDLNLEGVLRHSAADALSSIGVVAAAVLVLAAGWDAADPVASLVIAGLILLGSWRLLKEPIDVLLEAAPTGTNVSAIGEAMAAEPDVLEVHDLHVWTVTSGFPALSAHVVVVAGCDRDRVLRRVERLLHDRFGITHTTLQMMEETPADGLIQVERGGQSSAS
jgi:cobalt-zinc-cadmium efflux system protein